MPSSVSPSLLAAAKLAVLAVLVSCLGFGLSPPISAEQGCTDGQRVLNVGFYAFFAPVSHSADPDPAAVGFHSHRGYEADLLTALETMEDAGLSFSRRPIASWEDIWLRPTRTRDDITGGGITILDSRTRDSTGKRVVMFTAGHIAFRQSLLVRAAEAASLARYDALTSDVRVGVLAGTTGESRLLQLTGLSDANGILAAGVRIETPRGEVIADGSADHRITAGSAPPGLAARRRLHPPSETMPQVVYLGDETGEAALLEALRAGRIDAVARGEIGNREAAHRSGGVLAVTALDPQVEYGGFALAAEDWALASCIDRKITWLTDDRRIGFSEWLDDSTVFMRRARLWNETEHQP